MKCWKILDHLPSTIGPTVSIVLGNQKVDHDLWFLKDWSHDIPLLNQRLVMPPRFH